MGRSVLAPPTHTPLQQPPRCRAGEGDAAVRGGAPQGAARWGLIRAGLWDESCRASVTRIRAGILGDGGLGTGRVTGRGVSVLRVSGSKMWMGSLLD